MKIRFLQTTDNYGYEGCGADFSKLEGKIATAQLRDPTLVAITVPVLRRAGAVFEAKYSVTEVFLFNTMWEVEKYNK